MQMAEENLKLKEMSLFVKSFEVENIAKHEPLEKRYVKSIAELAVQKQKLAHQLQQVTKSSSREDSVELISNIDYKTDFDFPLNFHFALNWNQSKSSMEKLFIEL